MEKICSSRFWVYVLQSQRDGRYYVGSSQSIDERLRRHNLGEYQYTKGHRPWVVVYKELTHSRSEAVKKERFYKSGVGRKILKDLLAGV